MSSPIPSDLDGEELDPAHGVVVADDDERPSLVGVENDRSVDRHLQIVLELSAVNRIIKTRRGSSANFTFQPPPGRADPGRLRR